MNTNICKECGTENESDFIYCKNCGATIKEETDKNTTSTQNFQSNDNTYNDEFEDGVTQEDLQIFIGNKSKDILPKFARMKFSGSKLSWCWPAALLGFAMGPIGASFWFFYRKMYKPASILVLIGFLLSVINAVVTFNYNSLAFDAFFEALTTSDFEAIIESVNSIPKEETVFTLLAEFIDDAASTITCILCGLFGYHIYKVHCIDSIKKYKATQFNNQYYKLGLSSYGGVSGGMLAVGIVINFAIEYIITFITSIINVLT